MSRVSGKADVVAVEWAPGLGIAQGGLHTAVRAIVRDALAKRPGDTLSKNSDFREALGVGVGTVQRALDLLSDRAALRTVSRGHMGRRIESVDVGECWQAAGLPPVSITISPPGSVEIDSLEAWVADEFVRLGVPHTLAHLRGGNHRLEQLSDGRVDLTVVSAGTLAGLRPAPDSLLCRTLAPGTYYAPERLLVMSTGSGDGEPEPLRVAIDRDSFDHEALTLAQFPPIPGRTYVELPFPEVPAFVLAGVVDAGVWHRVASPVPLQLAGLRSRPIADSTAPTRDQLSAATIVARRDRPELRAVLDNLDLTRLDAHREAASAAEAAVAARLQQALDTKV